MAEPVALTGRIGAETVDVRQRWRLGVEDAVRERGLESSRWSTLGRETTGKSVDPGEERAAFCGQEGQAVQHEHEQSSKKQKNGREQTEGSGEQRPRDGTSAGRGVPSHPSADGQQHPAGPKGHHELVLNGQGDEQELRLRRARVECGRTVQGLEGCEPRLRASTGLAQSLSSCQ